MKNQSIILKILGGAFLVILGIALYSISEKIFPYIIEKGPFHYRYGFIYYLYNYIP